jgi:cell division inhibitor SulA
MEFLKELQVLLMNNPIWTGDIVEHASEYISTGFLALDELLPKGGWSRAGLVGIHVPREGAGELSVLLPALAQVSQEKRKVVFVAPPYLPYAPSLAQAGVDLSRYMLVKVQSLESRLWAIEQALRSGACGAVIFWQHGMDEHHLSRLHRAALEGNAIGFAFNHQAFDSVESGPLPLRLAMRPSIGARVEIEIVSDRDETNPIALTLEIPRGNPVLTTPLPPSRGRVGRIPAWQSSAQLHNKYDVSSENLQQPWLLQGIVA